MKSNLVLFFTKVDHVLPKYHNEIVKLNRFLNGIKNIKVYVWNNRHDVSLEFQSVTLKRGYTLLGKCK